MPVSSSTKVHFSTTTGFILTTAGSAIGLANIWKFPYIAYAYGGFSLILPYLFFMVTVAIPLFIAETTIGAASQAGPQEAFQKLSGSSRLWSHAGKLSVYTGFIISSFYSVVTGWIIGYAVDALIHGFYTPTWVDSQLMWETHLHNTYWTVGYHTLFALMCLLILKRGVRKGLERVSSIGMPIFFLCIATLLVWSTTLEGFSHAISYLFSFHDTGAHSGTLIMVALGHAFFTVSVGQGTLITYGSYAKSTPKLFSSALIIAIVDTAISIVASIILLSTAFSESSGITSLQSGPSLLFETLPTFFTNIPGGRVLGSLFFLLVFLAALTSQLSALEPMIQRLERNRNWSRKKASTATVGASWTLGIFSSLSVSNPGLFSLNGISCFDGLNFATTSLMLPMGAFFSAALFIKAYRSKRILDESGHLILENLHPWIRRYILWALYCAPLSIIAILLSSTGILSSLFT